MVDGEDLARGGGRARHRHGVTWAVGAAAAFVASLLACVVLTSAPGEVAFAGTPQAAGAAASGVRPTTATTSAEAAGLPPATTAAEPAPATTSPAVVTRVDPADPRIDAALALIGFPWQERLAGWQVAFLGRDDAYYGMTLVGERRIEVYVRDDQAPADIAGVLAHELGHAVDVTFLCWGDRYDWLTGRGQAPTTRWYVDDGASDFHSGAGDFAEAFAVWQVGRDSWSKLAGEPTAAQLAVLAELSTTTAPAEGRC